MFEEILRQLTILLGGSNKAGLPKIWIKGGQIFLRLRGMQRWEQNAGATENLNQGTEAERDAEAGILGERASVLDTPAMDYSRRTFSHKP